MNVIMLLILAMFITTIPFLIDAYKPKKIIFVINN